MTTRPVVVVGTSPLLLLRAVEAANAGDQVVVLEQADVVGGSWTVTEHGGWRAVETACHLLEHDRAAYQRLIQAGVALEPMVPKPQTQLPGRARLPYGSRRSSLVTLVLTPASLWRTWRAAPIGARTRSVRSALVRRLRTVAGDARRAGLGAPRIWYFRGGVAGAQAHLLGRLASVAHVRLATTVEAIEVTDGQAPRVILSSGEALDARVVLASDGLRGASILHDGNIVDLDATETEHHHLLLALQGPAPGISYLHLPYHRWLHRVTDVTASGEPTSDALGQRLLLVNTRREADVEEVRAELGRLRVLRDDHVVVCSWPIVSRSSRAHLDDQTRAHLAGLGLHVLPSHGDLIRSIRDDRTAR